MMLLIVLAFQGLLVKKREVKFDKRLLYGFMVILVGYLGIQLYFSVRYDNLVEIFTLNEIRLYYQLPLLLTLSLAYLCKVKYRNLNWDVSIKELLLILLVFAPLLLVQNFDHLLSRNVDFFYIRNFIQQLYYPSIVEEVLFRGLLLTGLLSVHIREDRANIIQAIAFGLIHLLNHNEISIVSILLISLQTFIGYIFGKLYLKTKSLTPGIILHALIDTI